METTELDTKAEEASVNGHDDTWKVFDDDQAFLQHIISKKPAEEIVEVPEWDVKILCRALNAEKRIEAQALGYNEKTKLINYRVCFDMIVMAGCFNPVTGKRIFTPSHRDMLMHDQDGGVIERLALTILRLSRMLLGDSERAKKN